MGNFFHNLVHECNKYIKLKEVQLICFFYLFLIYFLSF